MYTEYENEVVAVKLEELGDFVWNDEASEKMIKDSGQVARRMNNEVTLPSKVKYIGDWNERGERHGRGS